MGAEVADHWEVSMPVFMGTVKPVKYYMYMTNIWLQNNSILDASMVPNNHNGTVPRKKHVSFLSY